MSELPLIQVERDAIACLGLYALAWKYFDMPVTRPEGVTHANGLNIHAAMINDATGELIAWERNRNHSEESPFEHAELRVLRSAFVRMNRRHPRPPDRTLESHYREHLFSKRSGNPETSATLYTTLEPCPMCTATILASRIRRTVFLIHDKTFGGSWDLLKQRYEQRYDPSNDRTCAQIRFGPNDTPIIDVARDVHVEIATCIRTPWENGTECTLFLDYCKQQLKRAFNEFVSFAAGPYPVVHEGNSRTLNEFLQILQSS